MTRLASFCLYSDSIFEQKALCISASFSLLVGLSISFDPGVLASTSCREVFVALQMVQLF